MVSAWRRTAGAVVVALVCGVWGVDAAPSTGRVVSRLPLDDFESPATRYDVLDRTLPPKARGRVFWDRQGCRRLHANGACMRLDYAFDSPEPAEVSFRIDLADLDASTYDHLELWIRGDATIGFSPTLKVGFRRPKPGPRKLVEDGTAVVTGIHSEWQRIVVPLNRMAGIRDWTHLSAVFLALESRRAGTEKRGAYFIDDVTLLKTGERGPTVSDEVVPPRKTAWVKSVGAAAARRIVRERLVGWPAKLLADRASLPADDREFLERIARDTWTGIDALTDRENGLPVDHVIVAKSSASAPDVGVGDYTNITNVGLHLIGVAAAHDLGLVSAPEAVKRLARVLDTLERLETHEGFFFNYYDTVTLERTSHFISFVDSSWLTAGLMVVRMAFPELHERCSRMIDRQSYRFFYDEVSRQMSHGYYVNVPTRSEYHYGALYTEARLGSLIAIGRGDAPEDHWFSLVRTYPTEADWQSQPPKRWRAATIRGRVVDHADYEWKDFRFVPSWGGSMFEALMPALVIDERRHAPRSLGRNGEIHAEVQRRYATEELGYPVWGLSPSVTPSGDAYGEYGVRVLGTLGYDPGAVAPYAAALALLTMPDDATANLRRLAERYDVYGEYGFYDSVDPRSGKVAYEYLALDQAMILIAAANALHDSAVQKRFAADPIAARALPMLADEDFFD
jgi:hypothetical protein